MKLMETVRFEVAVLNNGAYFSPLANKISSRFTLNLDLTHV